MIETIQIAIDGPAGAGKSSVAKILATKLNYIYIDTGAMYRALTYEAILKGINPEEVDKLVQLAYQTNITFQYDNSTLEQRILCEGKDVSELIRSPQVSQRVSQVAAIPQIRKYMVKLQQDLAQKNNVIMDGRDIGTVVLPDAKYKFFLTASLEKRTQRRVLEFHDKGYEVEYIDIYNEIAQRDELDSQREISPLKPAKDAMIIDTSELTLEAVVNKILLIVLGEDDNVL